VNALVSDVMPANLTNVSWTSVATAGASDNQLSGTGNINDFVTLINGSSITYTVMGTVAANATTLGSLASFDFNGSSATDGPDGNARSFTSNGVTATVRGFSRVDGMNGAWAPAWLGSYGGGLGVTDSGEGDGSTGNHRVDNIGGRDNYVLFSFSESVVLDRAFLQFVINDSDLSVWIGNFSGVVSSLSDSVLSSFGFTEVNDTTLTTDRWADLNSGNFIGNTIVIAASAADMTPEDQFKIRYLDVYKATQGASALTNTATIAAPAGFTDTNPTNNNATDTDTIVLQQNYTKFYVANSAASDRTYEYRPDGSLVESYVLSSGNTEPRGVATTAVGGTVWVVDLNKNVYVYNTSGGLLGSWTAGSLPSNAVVEDITTNGTDIWIVDATSDKVYRYAGAASRLSGSQNSASNFSLINNSSLNQVNTRPKGLVTDGTSMWVVDDSTTDKVFKYSVSGTFLSSWTISSANASPTGITINPGNVSDIWIVDSSTCRVYQYSGAVGNANGSQQNANVTFGLAPGNTCPQGIADPPPQEMSSEIVGLKTEAPPVASMRTRILNRVASLLTPVARKKADLGSSNLQREEVSRLPVAVRGDLSAAGIRNRRTQQRTAAQLPATQTWSESLTSERTGFEQLDDVDGLFSDWTADPLELLGASGTH